MDTEKLLIDQGLLCGLSSDNEPTVSLTSDSRKVSEKPIKVTESFKTSEIARNPDELKNIIEVFFVHFGLVSVPEDKSNRIDHIKPPFLHIQEAIAQQIQDYKLELLDENSLDSLIDCALFNVHNKEVNLREKLAQLALQGNLTSFKKAFFSYTKNYVHNKRFPRAAVSRVA